MPEKILDLLQNGSLTEWQVCQALGLTSDELRACIGYLQQMGFIRSQTLSPAGNGCSGNCGSCHSSCHASSRSSFRVWEIVS